MWAHALQAVGADVSIYSRHSEDQGGVALTVTQTLAHTRHFPVIAKASEAPKDAVWLIMVKAWQIESLLSKLANEGLKEANLILSHNGMGAGDKILAANRNWQVFDLVTTHGAWRQKRTASVHAGLGESWLGYRAAGSLNSPPSWFVELARAFPPLHWEEDILKRRWQKLAVNCAINPLATLANAENGILQSDAYQPKIRAVCEEIANVNPALDADTLVTQVQKVVAATATNKCSMLQDVTAGKLTEIDFLNGFICNEGERLHVATRVNCALTSELKVYAKNQ